MAVLDVTPKVTDAGVEDVVQRVLAQKQVADDTHAACVLIIHPQSPQISNCVYRLLHLHHLEQEVLKRHPCVCADLVYHVPVLLDETDDSLSVVFGDVLRFILDLLLVVLVLLLIDLFLAVLVLRYPLLVCDHPRLLVESVEGELGQDGSVGKLHHGTILLLFFDDAVQHAVIVTHLIRMREDVVEFNLAQLLTLLSLVAIVVIDHREVKDRGAVTGLNQHGNVGDVGQQTVYFYYAHPNYYNL